MELSVEVEGLARLASRSSRAAQIVLQETKKALMASGLFRTGQTGGVSLAASTEPAR